MPDDSVKTWGCQYPQASLSAPGGTGFATIMINKLVMNYIVALRLNLFYIKQKINLKLKLPLQSPHVFGQSARIAELELQRCALSLQSL